MSNYTQSIRCTFGCGASVPARLQEIKTHNKIIVEAKYVCPKCGQYCKREVVSEKDLTK